MEQKYPSRTEDDYDDSSEKLSPRASPRSQATTCRFTYGEVSPRTQVNSFPHAVRLWQIYLK